MSLPAFSSGVEEIPHLTLFVQYGKVQARAYKNPIPRGHKVTNFERAVLKLLTSDSVYKKNPYTVVFLNDKFLCWHLIVLYFYDIRKYPPANNMHGTCMRRSKGGLIELSYTKLLM